MYRNQSRPLSAEESYEEIDNNAFDFYPLTEHGGGHRGLNPNNFHDKFDLKSAARRSCLFYANKINASILALPLSWQQKRLAMWTSFGMPGMVSLVRSFGFDTSVVKLARVIGGRIARFVDIARTTEKGKG